MKGFIVVEGKVIATRIIRTISQSKDAVNIETDDQYIVLKGNGDADALMLYILQEFNSREE